MSTEDPALEREPPRRLFLPSLAIAAFSVFISNAITTLLAVDIARTFLGSTDSVAVATVSQLNTFNAAAEIVFAILLSFLAVRFRHKPLLSVGVIFVIISTVGSFLAPSLLSLQFFMALEGGGSIMVGIMAFTLVGDLLPEDKKAKAISYIVSVGSLASLLVISLVGLIANVGGWRYAFLLIGLPVSVAGLILSSLIPSPKPREKNPTGKENPYIRSFKQILTNTSATACLVANILTVAGTQVAIFAIAFYRTRFAMPREWTVGIFVMAALIFIVASLISGRLVNKFGAKRVAVVSTILAAFFTMTFFFIPNPWIAVTFDMLHVWFAATATPAFVYLVLEQVPKFRGTIMSLNSIFNNVGNIIALVVGGALLAFTSETYSMVGLALGTMAIAGSAILLFFAKDPNRTPVGSH